MKYTGAKTKRAYRRMIVSAIVATAAFSITSLGWTTAPAAAAESRPEITTPLIQELQAQLAAVADRLDLSDEEREQLAAIYRDALDARRRAEVYRLKSEYVARLLAEAPDKHAALQAELDAPLSASEAGAAEEATLDDITARIAHLEADLATQRGVRTKLEGEITHRAERRTTLPRESSEAKLRADVLRQTLATLPTAGSETDRAHRARTEAQIAENEAKAALHSKELSSYDGRRELLATRRDLAALKVSRLEKDLTTSRQVLVAQREFAGQEANRAADNAREAAAVVQPALRELAAEVAQLAEERVTDGGLSVKLTRIEEQLVSSRAAGPELHKRFEGIRAKAALVGYTDAIGALLRNEKQALPSPNPHASRSRQTEIAATQLRMIELEEARRDVASITPAAEAIAAAIDGDATPIDRIAIEKSARKLVSEKRDYLDSLIDDYDKYFLALVELDNAERELMQESDRYERYIDEHVLWIRSAKVLSPTAIPDAVEAALWLARPLGWGEVVASFYRTATQRPGFLGLALALLALLFYSRSRLRRFVRDTGARTRNVRDERTFDAIAILGATFLVAFAWPALMNVASYVMIAGHDDRGGDLVVALASGLSQVAAVFLTFEFLRQLCRAGGLAETHLGWSRTRVEAIRLHSSWALPAGLTALLVALVLENHADADWQDSLGRTAFITSMIVLALFANRVLAPAVQPLRAKTPSLPKLSGSIIHFAAVAGPIVLALLAASGWYFSSWQLASNIPATNWLIVLIAVSDRLILRWLRLAELHLRREHARAALQEARKREERKSSDGLSEQTEAIEELPDVAAVSAQTRQLVRAVLGVIGAFGLFAIWGDMLPAFRLLDHVEFWTVGDSIVVTLADVMMALLFFIGAVVAARNVPGFLEIVILQRLPLDAGVRYAARAISRYLIAITGTMFGFGALGLGWSDVQWLVAAMTVGLGFGLQEIFANFVSGIILLFERPIRVGDTVTLGTTTGTVSRIHTRATTITDFDRKELVVPNKEFITGQLINWSLSDPILRVVIDVGVAYGSDVALTEAKLLEVAKECPFVLKDPEPSVLFGAFGASSLDFQLRAFIAGFDDWLRTRHELHTAIDAKFREADIEISFPQRDLHLRTVDGSIPVRIEN